MPTVPSPSQPNRSRALVVAAALLFVLAVLYLHHEVLFSGQVYHMDDAADGYYPSHVAILRAYAHGELPTWERGAWCGWPLAADPYYGAFYPLTVIFAIFGAVRGLGFTVVLHTLLAGLGMLWLLRRRKLDVGPALFGALAFGLSSFLVERVRHVIFIELMAFLPLVLVGIEGWLETRRPRELVLAAAATGMALLCGALPLLPYVILLMLAYVLPRLAREERRALALFGLAAAAGVGLLLGAAQLLPTLAHLPYSPRALGADYHFASSYAWPDKRYLATLVAPDLFGVEERGLYFGAFNHWEMSGYYVGALAVALAPLALVRVRRRPELLGLWLVTVLAIGLAFGDAGPFHAWFFKHVPLYAALRCPTRALVMAVVALPILGAEGLAWLTERTFVRLRWVEISLALLGIAIAILAELLASRALHPGPVRGFGHRTDPEAIAATANALRHLALVLGPGVVAIALLWSGRISGRVVALLLCLIALVDLVSIGRGYVQPKPADWARGTERFAAVDWLLAQKPPGLGGRFAPEAHGPFRLHNLGMTYAPLEGAVGYDSVSVWRFVNFLWVLNHGAPYPYPQLRDDLAAGDIKSWNSPLVDLMNVRWAIATHPPAPRFVERFHPRPGDKLHAVHEPLWDPQLGIYENSGVLPRGFVVYRAELPGGDDAQARALAKLDPRSTVILDRAPHPPPIGDARPLTPARLVSADRHHLIFEVAPTAPGVLVVSETDYPGWSATVDGKPAPLLRADYTFRGVALSAGPHRVEMHFVSRPARAGLALSFIGICALFVLGYSWRRPLVPARSADVTLE